MASIAPPLPPKKTTPPQEGASNLGGAISPITAQFAKAIEWSMKQLIVADHADDKLDGVITDAGIKTMVQAMEPLQNVLPQFRDQHVGALTHMLQCDRFENMEATEQKEAIADLNIAVSLALKSFRLVNGNMVREIANDAITKMGNIITDEGFKRFLEQDRDVIDVIINKAADAIDHPSLNSLRAQLPHTLDVSGPLAACEAIKDITAFHKQANLPTLHAPESRAHTI